MILFVNLRRDNQLRRAPLTEPEGSGLLLPIGMSKRESLVACQDADVDLQPLIQLTRLERVGTADDVERVVLRRLGSLGRTRLVNGSTIQLHGCGSRNSTCWVGSRMRPSARRSSPSAKAGSHPGPRTDSRYVLRSVVAFDLSRLGRKRPGECITCPCATASVRSRPSAPISHDRLSCALNLAILSDSSSSDQRAADEWLRAGAAHDQSLA